MPQLLIIKITICAISNVVAENVLSCHWLNENNNGLLRRDGLTKQLDFRNLPNEFVTQLMSKRNNLPRKSLGYRTPYEVFMSYVTDE